MRKTGILTYDPKYQTNCLEFNPFKPNVKPEKIFESIELSLNSPGYIPFLSKISGKGRIMFALAQIIFGISYAIFDAMHISGGNLTPRDETPHIFNKIRKGRLTFDKVLTFFSHTAYVFKSAPDQSTDERNYVHYNHKNRHVDWVAHGALNFLRGIVESELPTGVANAALFIYDMVHKYRFEYIHHEYKYRPNVPRLQLLRNVNP